MCIRDSTETYREKYPSSLFLPWPALHAVIKTLDLWVDLPEHYMGAVPAEQLPWMEIFELDADDSVRVGEVGAMLDTQDARSIDLLEGVLQMREDPIGSEMMPMMRNLSGAAREIVFSRQHGLNQLIRDRWKEATSSFFVVAPKEAFRSRQDWLARFRKLLQDASTEPTVAPDDPLVIRFCRGGCLVVAAWGDEATAINQLTRDLKI
jgi:hypothetical protein